MTKAEWEALLKRLQNRAAIQSSQDLKKMAGRIKALQGEIRSSLVNWERLAGQGDRTAMMMTQHLKNLEKEMGRIIDDSVAAINGDLKSSWQTWWRMGSQNTQQAAAAAGIALTELALATSKLDLYEQYIPTLIKAVGDGTKTRIAHAIRTAAMAGKDRSLVQRAIRDALIGEPGRQASRFGGMAYQVERIYRTESQRLYSMAAQDTAEKLAAKTGVDLVKIWNHSGRNALSRDNHVAMNGQVRDLDKPFSNGLQYPKDPNGSAAETINCRCFITHLPMQDAIRYGYSKKGAKPLATPKPKAKPKPKVPKAPVAPKVGRPGEGAKKLSGLAALPKNLDTMTGAEVKAWMAKQWDHIRFDIDKINDVESLRAVARGLATMEEQYPAFFPALRTVADTPFLGEWSETTWAVLAHGERMGLNPKYFDDAAFFRTRLQAGTIRKYAHYDSEQHLSWHPQGCSTIESVVTHEFGHVIDYQLEHPKSLWKSMNPGVKNPPPPAVLEDIWLDDTGWVDNAWSRFQKHHFTGKNAMTLSEYALSKFDVEIISEAVSMLSEVYVGRLGRADLPEICRVIEKALQTLDPSKWRTGKYFNSASVATAEQREARKALFRALGLPV